MTKLQELTNLYTARLQERMKELDAHHRDLNRAAENFVSAIRSALGVGGDDDRVAVEKPSGVRGRGVQYGVIDADCVLSLRLVVELPLRSRKTISVTCQVRRAQGGALVVRMGEGQEHEDLDVLVAEFETKARELIEKMAANDAAQQLSNA